MELDKSIVAELITAQKNEAAEHLVYKNLSSPSEKDSGKWLPYHWEPLSLVLL
jgi:hypothetical protein